MIKTLLTMVLFLVFTGTIFGQSKLFEKVTFSVSIGSAIPVGNYSSSSIQNAQLFLPEDDRVFLGLDKSKAGFAQTGLNYRFQIEYLFSPKIHTFIRLGRSSNPVINEVLETFFSDRFMGTVSFHHDNYQLGTVLTGLGYRKAFGNWSASLAALLGYGQMNYPYYQAELLSTTTDPKLVYSHSPFAERPNLSSLVYGGLFNVFYQKKSFRFGIDSSIELANFDYEMSNGTPGTTYLPFNNVLKTSLINLGLIVGYSF
ncbi:hypothetical protein SAMN03080617_00116 [Algoriphagus alkaliphilus]|uniref:Outer membrane protein beta-barrel domain-containing protein n=1 Tax=Algoriphagus alkaliphilus TaxID=279824 RepID=A0A1G5UW52_9BACT|nr:hypothetical protein [Algoriphagus alkaliphilus]SDA37862.1 hypothetical protein SAMN03080617_00116 [Algoriphagus alkaliphilus]